MPRKIKRLAAVAALAIILMIGGAGGFYAYLHSNGNFHVVEAGRFYRSAQLSAEDLNTAVVLYGIRSVLNLRGANPGSVWYEAEIGIAEARGIAHYDYAISAQHIVSVGQAEDILEIIQNAPKPMLVHCQGGSDRTGLVSALYRFSHGGNEDEAKRELSLRYGHFPYLFSKTVAMEESFRLYAERTKKNGASADVTHGTAPVHYIPRNSPAVLKQNN